MTTKEDITIEMTFDEFYAILCKAIWEQDSKVLDGRKIESVVQEHLRGKVEVTLRKV